MIKTLRNLEVEKNYLNVIYFLKSSCESIYKKTTANILSECVPSKIGK